MKKNESSLPTAVNRKQPMSRRVDSLLGQLNAFLDHPRANEILHGEWLHDSSLPAPSPELLDYLTCEMLFGLGRYDVLHAAETMSVNDAVKQFILSLRHTPEAGVRESVVATFQRQKLLSLAVVSKGGEGANALGWWLPLWSLWGDSGNHQIFPQGERRIAQFMFQAMMLRAAFYQDVKKLEGLAAAVRNTRIQSEINPPTAALIALQMFRWMPYLREKLGSSPQKSEMRFFLLEMYPDLSDSPKEWSAAAKTIRFERLERSKRVDQNLLLKIVAQAKNEGPSVKRKPAWRTAPESVGDDLPK